MNTSELLYIPIIDKCPFCSNTVKIAEYGFYCPTCDKMLLPLKSNSIAVLDKKTNSIATYTLPKKLRNIILPVFIIGSFIGILISLLFGVIING
jgi:capsular polysaccharide biosynthesis protein